MRAAGPIFAIVVLGCSPSPAAEPLALTGVRHWSLGDVTRIAIETSGGIEYKSDRLPNPDRIYFDLIGVAPRQRAMETITVGDALVRQLRIAKSREGVTRIVIDLAEMADYSASQLIDPDRLLIEIRHAGSSPGKPMLSAPPQAAPVAPQTSKPAPPARKFEYPPDWQRERPVPKPPILASRPPQVKPALRSERIAQIEPPAYWKMPAPARAAKSVKVELASAGVSVREPVAAESKAAPKPEPKPSVAAEDARIARPALTDRSGNRSLTRVLGLKLRRVVLDPGHGGHDTGTISKSGLREKDLVLDVSRRLGALIEDRMGSEVVYTRDEDRFVPLEQRTAIANRQQADLFLSIHANSSPVRSVSGVETFYLNFTTSKADMETAARENASSEKSIHELGDLLKQIALKDKVDESREFAARVQSAGYAFANQSYGKTRNRGVKKAPFVVLIGAHMPSVLVEIGFLTNSKEESLLRKPEHRQKLAEALYKGVSQYANTLSNFRLASTTKPTTSASASADGNE